MHRKETHETSTLMLLPGCEEALTTLFKEMETSFKCSLCQQTPFSCSLIATLTNQRKINANAHEIAPRK